MHLVLDVGNTNIKWALFDNNMLTDYQLIKDLSYDALKAIILKYQKINTLCVSNNTNRLNFIAKNYFDITHNNWTLAGFDKKFEEAFNLCKEKGIISNS